MQGDFGRKRQQVVLFALARGSRARMGFLQPLPLSVCQPVSAPVLFGGARRFSSPAPVVGRSTRKRVIHLNGLIPVCAYRAADGTDERTCARARPRTQRCRSVNICRSIRYRLLIARRAAGLFAAFSVSRFSIVCARLPLCHVAKPWSHLLLSSASFRPPGRPPSSRTPQVRGASPRWRACKASRISSLAIGRTIGRRHHGSIRAIGASSR